MSDTLERVSAMLVDVLGVDAAKVTPEATLDDDLGADSLDVLEIEMDMEDRFSIDIEEADELALSASMSVSELAEFVDKRIAAKAEGS